MKWMVLGSSSTLALDWLHGGQGAGHLRKEVDSERSSDCQGAETQSRD